MEQPITRYRGYTYNCRLKYHRPMCTHLHNVHSTTANIVCQGGQRGKYKTDYSGIIAKKRDGMTSTVNTKCSYNWVVIWYLWHNEWSFVFPLHTLNEMAHTTISQLYSWARDCAKLVRCITLWWTIGHRKSEWYLQQPWTTVSRETT